MVSLSTVFRGEAGVMLCVEGEEESHRSVEEPLGDMGRRKEEARKLQGEEGGWVAGDKTLGSPIL